MAQPPGRETRPAGARDQRTEHEARCAHGLDDFVGASGLSMFFAVMVTRSPSDFDVRSGVTDQVDHGADVAHGGNAIQRYCLGSQQTRGECRQRGVLRATDRDRSRERRTALDYKFFHFRAAPRAIGRLLVASSRSASVRERPFFSMIMAVRTLRPAASNNSAERSGGNAGDLLNDSACAVLQLLVCRSDVHHQVSVDVAESHHYGGRDHVEDHLGRGSRTEAGGAGDDLGSGDGFNGEFHGLERWVNRERRRRRLSVLLLPWLELVLLGRKAFAHLRRSRRLRPGRKPCLDREPRRLDRPPRLPLSSVRAVLPPAMIPRTRSGETPKRRRAFRKRPGPRGVRWSLAPM